MSTLIRIPEQHAKFLESSLNERYSFLWGGRRSAKTYSRLIQLYLMAVSKPDLKIQIIGSTSPIIRAGCLSDFENLFRTREGKDYVYNRSNLMFSFKSGSTIQFIQVDTPAKALQLGRASYRFINEMNNIDKEVFDNLAISTERQISGDWNPVREFWVTPLLTETNSAHFNWDSNPFLAEPIKEQFREWTEIGKLSRAGSPDYWRWQVYCEGNYCSLAGDLINVDDLTFTSEWRTCPEDTPVRYIAMVDPSSMHGGDSFAACLCGQLKSSDLILIDSFSQAKGDKREAYSKLREWKESYPSVQIYIERNGLFGQRFYNDCVSSGLSVNSWWSTSNKFDRIFANLDIIRSKVWILDTPANIAYVGQFSAFTEEGCKENTSHDDEIDALNNVLILLQSRHLLRTPLFQ